MDRKIRTKDWKITNRETIDADSGAHRIRKDSTYAQQKQQNAEIAKREDTLKRCADR